MTTSEKEKVNLLWSMGYSYVRISNELDIPYDTIKSHCRRHNKNSNAGYPKGLCKNCGVPVVQSPHRKTKLFCSDKCRTAWWLAHSDKSQSKHMERKKLRILWQGVICLFIKTA